GPDEPAPVGFLRTVADVYAFDPLPAAVAGTLPPGSGTLLGAQAQVWTEHLTDARRVDFATHPRLAAFAEVVWSPEQDRAPGSPASTEFLDRLAQEHLPRLDAAGVEYWPLDGPHPWQMRPGVSGHLRDLDAELAAGGWDGTGGWAEPGGAPCSGCAGCAWPPSRRPRHCTTSPSRRAGSSRSSPRAGPRRTARPPSTAEVAWPCRVSWMPMRTWRE